MPCTVGTDIHKAAEILRNGGLVAFATETVYGLGANALDPTAVAKVFAAKQRPKFDPLIVHVDRASKAQELCSDWPEMAVQLSQKFWPGPMTLVVPKQDRIPDLVTSGLDSVALRVPDHELAQQLLAAAQCPVAAPSANPFGKISPTTAQHVVDQLGDHVDYVLDGGPTRIGLESTVVSLLDSRPTVLRLGGLTVEQIEAVVGNLPVHSAVAQGENPVAPGQLAKHYAPGVPIVVVDSLSQIDDEKVNIDGKLGLLASVDPDSKLEFAAAEILSEDGNLTRCASQFFAALRRLDSAGLDRIIAIRFENSGLGRALNDRLQRAAADSKDSIR